MGDGLFNPGLMQRAARELWPITLFLSIALIFFEIILAYVIPTFQGQFSEQLQQMPFIQTMVEMLLGSEVSGQLGPETFLAFPWTHPVILAIFFAHALVSCTRVPAGELDRGTMDVLMSWPVSRWSIVVSEAVVWVISSFVLLAVLLAGNLIGSAFVEPALRPSAVVAVRILPNLWLLYMAVGALTSVCSAMSDRRGRAIAIAFMIVMVSFLLNFIAPFWAPAREIAFLSVMEYYRPISVFQDGAWPLGDMIVLTLLFMLFWTTAGMIFARRDLAVG